MNVNLGAPYEAILQRLIEKEYAGNRTEALRQALVVYERQIEEEERECVIRGIEADMAEIKSGKMKTVPLSQIKKELGL